MPQQTSESPLQSKPLFRYKLRSLLILMTICAAGIAWISNSYRMRKIAVNDIQAVGGTMGVRLAGPEWLRKSIGDDEYFYKPVRVSLGRITEQTEKWSPDKFSELVPYLEDFEELKTLDLRESGIGDSSLAEIYKLRNLEVLRLNRTEVSDEGLHHLKKLNNLQSLWLVDTNTTKQGIEELKKHLPNCEIKN